MRPCGDPARGAAGFDQAGPQGREAVAAGYCPDERRVGPKCAANQAKRKRQVVDRIESPDRQAKVEPIFAEIEPILFRLLTIRSTREKQAGIYDIHL